MLQAPLPEYNHQEFKEIISKIIDNILIKVESQANPLFIRVIGMPGSGKSTLSSIIADSIQEYNVNLTTKLAQKFDKWSHKYEKQVNHISKESLDNIIWLNEISLINQLIQEAYVMKLFNFPSRMPLKAYYKKCIESHDQNLNNKLNGLIEQSKLLVKEITNKAVEQQKSLFVEQTLYELNNSNEVIKNEYNQLFEQLANNNYQLLIFNININYKTAQKRLEQAVTNGQRAHFNPYELTSFIDKENKIINCVERFLTQTNQQLISCRNSVNNQSFVEKINKQHNNKELDYLIFLFDNNSTLTCYNIKGNFNPFHSNQPSTIKDADNTWSLNYSNSADISNKKVDKLFINTNISKRYEHNLRNTNSYPSI